MDSTSKIPMVGSPESPVWEEGGSVDREDPSPGLPAASKPASMIKKGKESWLLKNSCCTTSVRKEEKEVMKVERGGHLYKNVVTPAVVPLEGQAAQCSAMPAASVSMKVVKEERKGMEVGRGGHLYKNGAMPAVPMEARDEEKEVMKVVRGGHLYKNSAMPAAPMEVREEEKEVMKVVRGATSIKTVQCRPPQSRWK